MAGTLELSSAWEAGRCINVHIFGQRVERIETNGSTMTHHYYLYDGISLIDRRTGTAPNTAAIDRRFFTEGEQRLTGETWENYHYCRDHLGSVREVVKWDGTLAARYDYDPYGKRQTQYQSNDYSDGCHLGFTGHITLPSLVAGELELILAHYRAYDPDLGRWLSSDPLGEEGGINLYGYVSGSPSEEIDPMGLALLDEFDYGIVRPIEDYFNGIYRKLTDRNLQKDIGLAATTITPIPDDRRWCEIEGRLKNPSVAVVAGIIIEQTVAKKIVKAGRIFKKIAKRIHFPTRKASREAAEKASPIGKSVCEVHDNGHPPHYHPLDEKGEPTHDHYYFPWRFW